MSYVHYTQTIDVENFRQKASLIPVGGAGILLCGGNVGTEPKAWGQKQLTYVFGI